MFETVTDNKQEKQLTYNSRHQPTLYFALSTLLW